MPLGTTEQLKEEKAANTSGLHRPKHSQSTELSKWVEHFHFLLLSPGGCASARAACKGRGRPWQGPENGCFISHAHRNQHIPFPKTSPRFPTASTPALCRG